MDIQHGCRENRAGITHTSASMCNFFFKIAVAIRCYPPKFKSQSAAQNQNLEANISNPFGSKFKTYSIQNSIFIQTLQVIL